MSKIAHFLAQLEKSQKLTIFFDAINTRKWLDNYPRVNLCKRGDENSPSIRNIRRIPKLTIIAIYRNFLKQLLR